MRHNETFVDETMFWKEYPVGENWDLYDAFKIAYFDLFIEITELYPLDGDGDSEVFLMVSEIVDGSSHCLGPGGDDTHLKYKFKLGMRCSDISSARTFAMNLVDRHDNSHYLERDKFWENLGAELAHSVFA